MKAYVLHDFDGPPRLTTAPIPVVGAGQVRVRVRSSSVNPVDAAIARGFFRGMYDYRLPAVLGRDFAGTVDDVGEGVTAFRPGDEVFGMVKRDYIGDGTFAEFVVVDEDRFLVPRPEGVDVASAGALGLAGVTALQCVEALDLAPGQTVFINGAAGGVGTLAIQIAKARGLHVVATARAGDQDTHLRALGADTTIDWTAVSVVDEVRRRYPAGVDGVIDLVSRSPQNFAAIAEAASGSGTVVTTLGAAPEMPTSGRRLRNVHSDSDPALLTRVAELVADGSVRVIIIAAFPFNEIAQAFDLLATGPDGKVGLSFDD